MKNAIIILLAFMILAFGLKDATMFAFFKINQTRIIENSCVNKDKPMKMCHGKCFLKKKIEESNDVEQNAPNSNKVEKPTQVNWILEQNHPLIDAVLEENPKAIFADNNWFSQTYLFTIFQPPRQSA